jgi:hypothetical protein
VIVLLLLAFAEGYPEYQIYRCRMALYHMVPFLQVDDSRSKVSLPLPILARISIIQNLGPGEPISHPRHVYDTM